MSSPNGDEPTPRAAGSEWSLRRQLFALFLIFSLGPLVLTNVWGYLQSSQYSTASELRAARDVASLEASAVLHFVLQQHQWTASVVAGNQHLFSLLRALNRPEGDARQAVVAALRDHLAAKAHENDSVRELTILGPEGDVLASSLGVPGDPADQSESACFRRGRQVAAVNGVDFQSSEPVLLVSAPIRDGVGDLVGVICARHGYPLHLDVGRLQGGRFSKGAMFLLDRHGRVIDTSLLDPATAARGKTLPDAPPSWSFGAESWEGRFRSASGEVLAAWAPIPELGWGVLVQEPVQAALAAFHTLKWQALGFGGLLATLVVGAVHVVARRISGPIIALSDAANRVTLGELGVTASAGGAIEVSNLARAFNRMEISIKDAHDLLEERIANRTRELQRSQEFAERLLNSIDEPVLVVDKSLRLVSANPTAARRYGATLVGQPYHPEGSCPGGSEHVGCPVCATFATGRPVSVERIDRIGTVEDVVNVRAFPVLSAEGGVDAVIELRRIVTDERRLQARMVSQEKMSALGLLAAGVAHEVANPLAAIESQIRLALEVPAAGRTEATLDIVAREVRRITGLLRELTSFGRSSEDEVVLVTLDHVIEDVTRLVRHDPRASKVTIAVDCGPAVVRARADHMVQIFLNLAINALDAMPKGGALTFRIAAHDGRITARVCDTGSGVPADIASHIFEPFFTTKAPGRGTGLGLFVTRGLVEALGGNIGVEETGPAGSVFRIDLPAAKWQARATS